MKSIVKTLLLFLIIFSAISIKGEATEVLPSNIKLEGNSNGIVFISGDEPFLYKNNMLPGDSVSRKMILKNNYTDSYAIYLRGARISKKEAYDLLSKIDLKITYDNTPIYNGVVSGEEGMSEDIPLGTVKPGEEKDLVATATLDGRLVGNEFKNKYGAVEWIFTAVRIPSEVGKRTGGSSIINNQPNKEDIINTVKEYVKKLLPKTGYESEYIIGGIIIIAGIYLVIKKKK